MDTNSPHKHTLSVRYNILKLTKNKYFSFKGAQPATRYEMASVVARALAKVDAEKASKQDLEMLKKLVMEFKDELDALGVKVDKIDKRVAVLEDRLGGWKLTGEFRFDAKFAGDNGEYSTAGNSDKKFETSRYRLHLTKYIDENTKFYAQLNGENATFRRYYVDTVLPYGVAMRVGKINIDWEDELGLYIENDATFGDFTGQGFQFDKTWGIVKATAVAMRGTGAGYADDLSDTDLKNEAATEDHTLLALKLHADFNEKFRAGAMGYWFLADDPRNVAPTWPYDKATGAFAMEPGYTVTPVDVNTYGLYAGFDFTPSVTLQGVYYWQDVDIDGWDNQKSWKAQLKIKQDLLKFTALHLEYGQEDNGFVGWNATGAAFSWTDINYDSFARPFNEGTTKYFFVRADQKWNDKWSSFLRYVDFDWDTATLNNTKNYTAAIAYQYTPAINFQLAYDYVDAPVYATEDSEHLVRFRTYVSF